jgi:hypothetical protein
LINNEYFTAVVRLGRTENAPNMQKKGAEYVYPRLFSEWWC